MPQCCVETKVVQSIMSALLYLSVSLEDEGHIEVEGETVNDERYEYLLENSPKESIPQECDHNLYRLYCEQLVILAIGQLRNKVLSKLSSEYPVKFQCQHLNLAA